ncbi:MAG: recombinase XerC [Rhodobacteraceae bacterium]|nr:recombinase XerC [Paracoccaceae bacterium]MBO28949.1 recombinase XerC [Paracoccaceae bacterium]|tara:strand:- start:64 stop:771 length:708 start_codon:yes stop_codon:yes gene_type:complete
MSSTSKMDDSLREAIISRPDVILDDSDVMQALIAANEKAMGGNIVDLRGIAMERLETRLDRLEDTHRNVIAAAYENLSGTNQIHRAILRMLDPVEFETFLRDLGGDVADILRVDAVKLVLESVQNDSDPAVQRLGEVLSTAEPGFIDDYLTQGRGGNVRQVTLRGVQDGSEQIYGEKADWIRSEACLKLDFGAGRLPGLLVLGTEDPHMFGPQQGTDLLVFFTGVFERAMRRWLS